MLLPYLSLLSAPGEIEEFLHAEFLFSFTAEYRMTPGRKVPAITNEADNKILSMTWGLEMFPGISATPWLRSEGIISRAGARILIRTRRCLVLANCFFIRKEQSVYLIYHPGEKILALAAVWKSALKPDRSVETSLAVLTRESPQALKKIAQRIPVIISRSLFRKYLNIKCPLMDITGILGSNRYPQVNGYPLAEGILKKSTWSRHDLLPAGNSIFPSPESSKKLFLHDRNFYR